ncbi:MAG TPA: ComEC/Rec2 family competence protein [Candidatus Paceibacterota bacterium]|nr:ComEC/Rec2 family competence protein [Candidatus Paceibacterota bacterium]
MPLYNIAFYGALSFIAGTIDAGFASSAFWAVLFFGIAVIAISYGTKTEWHLASFFIFAFAFGIFYYGFFFNAEEAGQKIIFGQNIEFSGIVSKEPQLSEKYQRLTVELYPPLAGEISVLAPLSPEMNYGDVIEATGEISAPSSASQEPVSFFPKIKITGANKGLPLKEKLIGFKKSIIAQFKEFLPSDSAALLSGLTLGWRGDFTDEFKKEMSLSGTTHMVALSGYNITILVLVVAGIFGYWLSRRATFWLTSVSIVLFILMVGAEASVIRAAIMGFLALFAEEAGRRFSMRNAIALTAAAMIIANPGTVFEIGFILSFLSLIGIVLLKPAISNFLRIEGRQKSFMSWRENAITTLSAQLAVAPVLIIAFGNFSLTSILANVLILEFVPLTMLLGFALALFGSVFYYSGFIISLFTNILLKYELWVIKLFASLSVPFLSETSSWIFFGIYYLALAVFILHMQKRKELKLL